MISDSYQTTRTREAKSATQNTNDSMGQTISVISNYSGAVKIGNRNSLDHVEYLFPYYWSSLEANPMRNHYQNKAWDLLRSARKIYSDQSKNLFKP
jgi:hypothetical protein